MSEDPARGFTRALVRHARGIDFEAIPQEALEATRHCLLDYLGCAIAGSREELSKILVESLVASEAGSGASVIGQREKAMPQTAALVNGSIGHALDFDDTHGKMGGHPSVPVIPALLAAAESGGESGRDFMTALTAAFEVQSRLGMATGPGHYAKGFHTTGTVGSFGAAAAVAHLMKLDEERWCHAMGLAGTQAAGLKSGFGTMAKPMHAGRAAQSGYLAALLAKAGFTANPEIVETDQGFIATHAGAPVETQQIARDADRWFVRETLFKYHAACYLTHASIEAIASLRMKNGIEPDEVDSVSITVNPALLGVCNIEKPTTGLEGKFSLRATAALSLLGVPTDDPATFTDATMQDPRVQSLRDRVRVETAERLGATQARVSIDCAAGRFEAEMDTGQPASDLGQQGRRLAQKFERLSAPVIGTANTAELLELVNSIEHLPDLSRLMAATRPD